MSWLFSQALVEEYLQDKCLDGEQSAQSSGKPIPQAYCAPDKTKAFLKVSQYGMTFKPLTQDLGEALLMSYLAGFHAKTSQQEVREKESRENDQECGEKWRGSFTKYNPDTSSWRTHQCSLVGDLEEFSETWPQWGLMRDGECWEQQMLAQTIKETESGLSLLPTPTASMMPCEGTVRIMRKAWLKGEYSLEDASVIAGRDVRKSQGKVKAWPTPTVACVEGGEQSDRVEETQSGGYILRKLNKPNMTYGAKLSDAILYEEKKKNKVVGGKLNPTWTEWLMGWPLGWTDLKPLETDKSHCAQPQLGES
jgi:hypothetical protein